jgi:protein XRP2
VQSMLQWTCAITCFPPLDPMRRSTHNRAFSINDVNDSDVFILDSTAQIQIDDCLDSFFFIGPVAGSAFLRDCKNCKCAACVICSWEPASGSIVSPMALTVDTLTLRMRSLQVLQGKQHLVNQSVRLMALCQRRFIVMCRQFRCRDLEGCEIMLHCRTQPIIESSTDLGFCCWTADYFGLADQMATADLSIFHNFWSHIHNFTPKKATSWELIDEATFRLASHSFWKQGLPDDVKVRFTPACAPGVVDRFSQVLA